MISFLRGWVSNICCTLFFITVAQMILPDNSMKKYSKFVLGLILIAVIMKPLLTIFSGDVSFSQNTNNILNETESNNLKNSFNRYREENIQNTLKSFKENLKISCEKNLREKFPNSKFQVSIEANYDNQLENFKLIKVNIVTNQSDKNSVIDYLSNELKIDKEIITIQKG